jgi:undecaprenyl-diphosphatase
MSVLEAIVLGIIQGATEFLPVSSSGHLVLTEHLLGLTDESVVFEVAVHAGTLAAVLLYFRTRILSILRGVFGQSGLPAENDAARRMLIFLVIGSVPAAVTGLLFKSEIESFFGNPRQTALFLIVTGVWLLLMRFAGRQRRVLNTQRSWWIGCAQAAAILPGISRSGATIATGALLGVPAAQAAEFSFLLSIPAVAGAAVLSLPEAMGSGQFHIADGIGAVVAGVTGYVALKLVFASLRRGRFAWFGVYCIVLGTVAAVLVA